MAQKSAATPTLGSLLRPGDPVLLPGCYDALGARLIEQAGFDAVYMTGFGTTASLIGRPDVGLLGMSEMVDNARRIVSATDRPVLADADTGYGNPINVIRTVREYEQAGVAAIHIEDQVAPKRCGHMEDKAVIEQAEFVAKIRAAVDARRSDDFAVVARTDAAAPNGLDDALERGRAARDSGADALFIEAPQGVRDIEVVAETFGGVPLVFNWVEGGKTPPLSRQQIADLGFAAILMPISLLFAATRAMQDALRHLAGAGSPLGLEDRQTGFGEFTDLIGLPDVLDQQQRYT